ncbi:MAG: helix-turn-helix domain-containing protein [Lachnospiraceae bacterium]|nr:helix-turn-helix domain-containing protein [Lachnospiraceae bacterium]
MEKTGSDRNSGAYLMMRENIRDIRENENAEQEFFTVTEAVQRTGVASHVLRYWEDELGISIRRTALGHRIYSEEDLALFLRVKALKEKGIQLKAIRLMLDESAEGADSFRPERLFGKMEGARPERLYGKMEGTQPERVFEQVEDTWSDRLSGQTEGIQPEITAGTSTECVDAGMNANMLNMPGVQKANMWGSQEANMPSDQDANTPGGQNANTRGGREEREMEDTQETAAEFSSGSEYEVIPAAEADNYLRFERMLRDLVSEAVGEQNEKLKQEIADIFRDEMENLYIQLQQEEGRWEAAASRMSRTGRTASEGRARIGLLERIRRRINAFL